MPTENISIIIPHYPIKPELDELLKKCVASLKGYDELIIVVNEGIGFAKAVNQGLRLAKGDYLMVVNNDIEWTKGDLKDLCDKNAVTSPIVNGKEQKFWGCFFCLPRWVYEKIGGLDERFEIGYFEDDDYMIRLTEAGIPMKSKLVEIKTEGGNTMNLLINKYEENKAKFNEKWTSVIRN